MDDSQNQNLPQQQSRSSRKFSPLRFSSNKGLSPSSTHVRTRTTNLSIPKHPGTPLPLAAKNTTWEAPGNTIHPREYQGVQNEEQQKRNAGKRVGLTKVGNFSHKASKEKLEFSKVKPKKQSQKSNKQNMSPLLKHIHKHLPSQAHNTSMRTPHNKPIKLQQFKIGKRLGKGKFGEVFLAKDIRTNFIFALKIIDKCVIRRQQFQQQLVREIKIQSFLDHPNIVKLFGYFNDQDRIYMLLEYCSSGQLLQLMDQHPKLDEKEVSAMAKQVLSGLNEMHSHKILHRDMKPENILVQHNTLKIGDLGWATIHQHLKGSLCGTPLYFSPQMLTGQQYDEKIDIWAVGIITYEMLYECHPFRIKTQTQLARIVQQDISFPEQRNCSSQARDFIGRMLDKDPEARSSVSQLLHHEFIALY